MRPFGGGIVDADAVATQDYLTGSVRRGDCIQLELVHVRDSEEPIPFYAARHGSRLIAETTEDFGRAFARRLGAKTAGQRWPLSLKGVSVDGLETVLGLPSAGSSCGLGATGLWLRPRLLGLADLHWNQEDSQVVD